MRKGRSGLQESYRSKPYQETDCTSLGIGHGLGLGVVYAALVLFLLV